MQKSKDIVKNANIIPRLKLAIKTDKGVQGTGPHRVKFLADKEAKGTDPQTGAEREEVAYLVEENGEKKSYRVPKIDKKGEIHYLVQRFADIPEGGEAILEYKRKGLKGFIQVLPIPEHERVISDDDIPVINEDESNDFSEEEQKLAGKLEDAEK